MLGRFHPARRRKPSRDIIHLRREIFMLRTRVVCLEQLVAELEKSTSGVLAENAGRFLREALGDTGAEGAVE